jgi:hypothetical protein
MTFIRKNLISLTFLTVLALSLAANIYLGRTILSIKVQSRITPQEVPEGKIGQHLDSLQATPLAGTPEPISLSGKRSTILYVFSPSCHWCMLNFKNLQALFAKSKDDYNFIGVAVNSEGLDDYLRIHPYGFAVYKNPTDADLRAIGFVGTPQTLLISPDGRVEHNWTGAYAGTVGDSIEHTFAIHLPGLQKQAPFALSTQASVEAH